MFLFPYDVRFAVLFGHMFVARDTLVGDYKGQLLDIVPLQ
jgi:hypothetical protein